MKYRLIAAFLVCLAVAGGILWWGHNHPYTTHKKPAGTPTSNQTSSFNKQRYSLDKADSPWVVVNKKRPLNPITFTPTDLTDAGNGQLLRAEAASALSQLVAAAKQTTYSLLPESGYRSYQTQVTVYNHEVQAFGQAKANSESAQPGYSEHQTGWAVDMQTPGCLEDCFAKSAAAGWLKDNSYRYGFVLRYTPDKTAITGYRSEPWHIRFVGIDLATELHNRQQTMEEFFGLPAVGQP